MQNKINITEEDIFKFVFNPESLPGEIFDYLTQNQEHFASEISFCKEMSSAPSDLSDNIAVETFKKLNKSKVIELLPSNGNNNLDNGIKLAAASLQHAGSKTQSSFSDPEMNYLIRLVNVQSQNLLFFFTKDIVAKQYEIKFYPSENSYTIRDTTKPIEILEEGTINRIELSVS